jgi:hypothetical protein
MKYKIIQNNKVIDVVQNPRFVRFLSSGHIALTDKSSAHGVIGSDTKTIYSFDLRQGYLKVSIEKINSEEFNRLQSLLNSEQSVSANESALAEAKKSVLENLSNICRDSIIAGFSIKLSDEKLHEFKLTPEDQLNLLSIENQLNAGVKTFVYHTTNEPCRVFTRNDMERVIKVFRKHVLYHTTYFNVAKQYINSLVDIDKVNSFTYGTSITGTTKDPILRKILQDGGVK